MKKKDDVYTLSIEKGVVKIRIRGVLFLSFWRCDYRGLMSYKDDYYGIDIYLTTGTIEVDIEDRQLWENILKLLDSKL